MPITEVSPSDLGRRVAEQRLRAGLSRAELAARAGLAASYLEYLETSATPSPGPGGLLRLAAALGTTPEALTGASVHRPPGERRAGTAPVLTTLSLAECRRRLAAGGVGRFLFTAGRGPVAIPVNYRMLGGDIVFATADGSAVAAATRQPRVSFEVDRIDDALAEGWSVLASGRARQLPPGPERDRAAALGISPWAGGRRDTYLLLTPRQVTGRCIRAG
jgi:transcriptional regulator with XRE-family HTH domain